MIWMDVYTGILKVSVLFVILGIGSILSVWLGLTVHYCCYSFYFSFMAKANHHLQKMRQSLQFLIGCRMHQLLSQGVTGGCPQG